MGVLLQAFYWDCPKLENKEFEWWGFVKEKIKGTERCRLYRLVAATGMQG
jgi:alpha-amylase